jgi:integrase/recombinase XerD
LSDSLFLNYQGEPILERGVQKLLAKYVKLAGITKKIFPHSLRHTFATYKAERGVSPYQLQQWLGHRNLNTTQIYVHLGKQNSRNCWGIPKPGLLAQILELAETVEEQENERR